MLVPDKLGDKTDQWRLWKRDFMDFADTKVMHMKKGLTEAIRADGKVDKETMRAKGLGALTPYAIDLFRLLKGLTSGEANKIVNQVADDDGWTAWKALSQYFEPGLAAREAQVFSEMTNMVRKRSANYDETKRLIVELESKIRKVEEVSGKKGDDQHAKKHFGEHC